MLNHRFICIHQFKIRIRVIHHILIGSLIRHKLFLGYSFPTTAYMPVGCHIFRTRFFFKINDKRTICRQTHKETHTFGIPIQRTYHRKTFGFTSLNKCIKIGILSPTTAFHPNKSSFSPGIIHHTLHFLQTFLFRNIFLKAAATEIVVMSA